MQCIEHGRALIADDDFIDPYGENPDGYTNESLKQALDEVEKILMDAQNEIETESVTAYQFEARGYFIDIDEHSEGGFYYSIYKSENDYENGEDDLDGGLCTGMLDNAVRMALDAVIDLYNRKAHD